MKKTVLTNDRIMTVATSEPDFDDNIDEELISSDEDDDEEIKSILDEIKRKLEEEMSSDDEGEEDDDEIEKRKRNLLTDRYRVEMDAEDYHNESILQAELGHSHSAIELCKRGLSHFPDNVDLTADIIKYSSDSGDMAQAEKYYSMLKKIPVFRYNWRAFTFSLDFLIKKNPVENEKECRRIIKAYKEYLAFNEKAYMAESDLEDALGNSDRSIEILEQAIQKMPNCPQCSLKLADKYFDRGLYDKCLSITNYGIAASASSQPSINDAYLVFIGTLANDYLLHRRVYEGERVSRDDVEAIKTDYKNLLKDFSEQLRRYKRRIETRMKLLNYIKVS